MDDVAGNMARIETVMRGMLRRVKYTKPQVLLTGGTGTLGTALTQRLLDLNFDVTVVSRDPHHQAVFLAKYPHVKCVLADICNRDAILDACTGKDIVIHAAALKRVDTGEAEVSEFNRVNIEGTRIVADCAHQAMVDRALFISSDKAVAPLNFYGMTKAIGERIWLVHNDSDGQLPTRFSVVRYGNVMGSNGSVLQLWRERIARGQKIIVREPETTRFFMTVCDAVDLVECALNEMIGGEIFVPDHTPAFALYDLARTVAPESEWIMQPLGPREKQHERLLAPGEFFDCQSYGAVRVWPDRAGDFKVPDEFCSERARRLTGEQTVKLLENK